MIRSVWPEYADPDEKMQSIPKRTATVGIEHRPLFIPFSVRSSAHVQLVGLLGVVVDEPEKLVRFDVVFRTVQGCNFESYIGICFLPAPVCGCTVASMIPSNYLEEV